MNKIRLTSIAALFLIFTAPKIEALETGGVSHDHRIAFGIGLHDVIQSQKLSEMVTVELRSAPRFYTIRPVIGTWFSGNRATYTYFSLRSELGLSRLPLLFSINTGMGYYNRGDDIKLGHHLEFRSGFELYRRLDNDAMAGLAFHHMSNAGAGRHNPGTEILTLFYDFPVGQIKTPAK